MEKSASSFAIPDELPVLPLRDMVVFPYMVVPLFVARERSIAAVYQIVEGRFIHVYPPVIASGKPTVLLPASSPWAAR